MTLLYIIGIIVLVGLSAFYSATETAFNSVSEKRLRNLYEERKHRLLPPLAISVSGMTIFLQQF